MDEIVEEGKAEVTSNKVSLYVHHPGHSSLVLTSFEGNTITRTARGGDPAVKITRKGVSQRTLWVRIELS